MDDPTAQTEDQTLPELIRSMLGHMRGLRLKGPPTFQHEHYADVWQALAAVGNYLVDRIEDLRFKGHEQWETGDEASIQQFGRLSVPQGKDLYGRCCVSLLPWARNCTLLQHARASTLSASIQTWYHVLWNSKHRIRASRWKTRRRTMSGWKMPRSKPSSLCHRDQFSQVSRVSRSFQIQRFSPSLMQHAATSSFKPPTAPRPADYKTPPRGPSFSPVTPPPWAIAETNSNSHNNNNNYNPIPPHAPLQYPNDQRFQTYISSINFTDDHDHDPHSIFNSRTPTAVQEEVSPPPQLASQAPDPATSAALTEQEYTDSVKLVVENITSLVFLMVPEPKSR